MPAPYSQTEQKTDNHTYWFPANYKTTKLIQLFILQQFHLVSLVYLPGQLFHPSPFSSTFQYFLHHSRSWTLPFLLLEKTEATYGHYYICPFFPFPPTAGAVPPALLSRAMKEFQSTLAEEGD